MNQTCKKIEIGLMYKTQCKQCSFRQSWLVNSTKSSSIEDSDKWLWKYSVFTLCFSLISSVEAKLPTERGMLVN